MNAAPLPPLRAPFPYFGGKSAVASQVWERLGRPKQYIEPFCGSAAMLLAAPRIAPLEVIGDWSGFIANFWRSVVHQHAEVARWADYPISHIDLGARHRWLMEQRDRLAEALHDPEWPGDPKVAGWWLWGQCAWIGSGWCEWGGPIPHVSNAGMGVQAHGQIPHVSNAGMGIHSIAEAQQAQGDGMWTSGGEAALRLLAQIARRMERVRVIHGDWSRCLNHHYGGAETAIFFDPPYLNYEQLYGGAKPVAASVAEWCREHPHLRIALCGHRGDYDLPGWDVVEWKRPRLTYGGSGTTAEEAIWFSPACHQPARQEVMF